jgi:AraC-like DNA-binding protein
MLRRSSIPTFVVARLCGFINVSHFIASFKRRYGITPSRLIRQRVAEVAMGALPHCPSSRIW